MMCRANTIRNNLQGSKDNRLQMLCGASKNRTHSLEIKYKT